MAYRDDSSTDYRRWTNRKLFAELRRVANFEHFGCNCRGSEKIDGDDVRKITKLYRETWLNPLIDELEQRHVK